MDTSDERAAFGLIVDMLERAGSPSPNFPPTELYSEGWMLRLLLETAQQGHGGMPVRFSDEAHWYSEARLPSAFLPRFRGDPLAEGYTHADGVVGHFGFSDTTLAGVKLDPDATQFVVVEAKMLSKLAAGTTKAEWFDQAVRNVAAMAWTIHESNCDPDQFSSLAFLVTAPLERIDAEPSFHSYTSRESIVDKVERRICMYGDPGDQPRLRRFQHDTFEPFLGRVTIGVHSWEELLETVDEAHRRPLEVFYAECLQYNGPKVPPVQG